MAIGLNPDGTPKTTYDPKIVASANLVVPPGTDLSDPVNQIHNMRTGKQATTTDAQGGSITNLPVDGEPIYGVCTFLAQTGKPKPNDLLVMVAFVYPSGSAKATRKTVFAIRSSMAKLDPAAMGANTRWADIGTCDAAHLPIYTFGQPATFIPPFNQEIYPNDMQDAPDPAPGASS